MKQDLTGFETAQVSYEIDSTVLAGRSVDRVRLAYHGVQAVISVVFRGAGVALILTASLMWVWPGAIMDMQGATMKLGVSVFVLLCGLALLMRHHEDAQPEVEFDTNRRELRFLELDDRGRWEIRQVLPFDVLGEVFLLGREIRVESKTGDTLVRMRLRDQASEDVMRSLLRAEFPHLA